MLLIDRTLSLKAQSVAGFHRSRFLGRTWPGQHRELSEIAGGFELRALCLSRTYHNRAALRTPLTDIAEMVVALLAAIMRMLRASRGTPSHARTQFLKCGALGEHPSDEVRGSLRPFRLRFAVNGELSAHMTERQVLEEVLRSLRAPRLAHPEEDE